MSLFKTKKLSVLSSQISRPVVFKAVKIIKEFNEKKNYDNRVNHIVMIFRTSQRV